MTINKNEAVLEFDNVGGGLITKNVDVDGGNHVPESQLKGFAVCGADKKFKWAAAVIRDNTVVVSCPDVAEPVAVRTPGPISRCAISTTKRAFRPYPSAPISSSGRTPAGWAVSRSGNRSSATSRSRTALEGSRMATSRIPARPALPPTAPMKFPKEVTVDLQGRFTVSELRVYNSAFGGTKTVEVQVSGDGEQFTTLGKTQFKNYAPDMFELTNLNAKGVGFVRLVFPDVHETSFQHKVNGFIFLRELEVQGTRE